MSNHATPNLPARSFDATEAFYRKLGFERGWRDDGWMILKRGEITLEFFPDPEVDPLKSSFGCCVRLDDLDAFYGECIGADLPETCFGQPRLHPPRLEESGKTIAYLVDPDGTLLRLVQN